MFPPAARARQFPAESLGLAQSDEASGKLTLSFNVLDLGAAGFTANFDSRTPIIADTFPLFSTAAQVLTRADFALVEHTLEPSHFVPSDSEFVQTLLEIYRDFTGDTASQPFVMSGMTYVHNVPGGVAFGTSMPGVGNRIHGRDEFITIENLVESAKMFTAAILKICN